MTFSEETLMAYADNELDAQTRTAVEAAMAADPEIARRVAQHKALRGKVRLAFDNVINEPTPQRLVKTARGTPTREGTTREGNVIPLRRKAPQRRGVPLWVSIAASLVIGIVIGQAMLHGSGSTTITSRDGQLLASGVLAHALSAQLASAQTDQNPVQIGVSFKSKAGDYCRTFAVHESTTLAGLACRQHDDWHVQVLAQTTPTTQSAGAYRQAASEIPKSVLQSVDDNIAGDPLDAHAETAARDKNWSP
jgi:hypothetical protein